TLTFAPTRRSSDLFLKLRYEGIAIASRIPRMMMTTRSSIKVKPLSSLLRRCLSFAAIVLLLPSMRRGCGVLPRYRRGDRGGDSLEWGMADWLPPSLKGSLGGADDSRGEL